LFLAEILTAFALRRYEIPISHWQWLVFFIPLINSSGGNSGNQSATLIITALTNGDVGLADWWRVARREILMGLLLGGFLACIGFLLAIIIHERHSTIEAIVLPLTLILVVLSGTTIGSLLPLAFRRIGWDPALMSNPCVAGIIDILGIFIYFNVALAVLTLPAQGAAP
jgi:magnesium transporter